MWTRRLASCVGRADREECKEGGPSEEGEGMEGLACLGSCDECIATCQEGTDYRKPKAGEVM